MIGVACLECNHAWSEHEKDYGCTHGWVYGEDELEGVAVEDGCKCPLAVVAS